MAAQFHYIDYILLHGRFRSADPGRAVIVDIGLGDIQGHIFIQEVAFHDDHIIGGDGACAVQTVVTNGPAFQLQIILIIADLDDQRSVNDTNADGLAATDDLNIIGAGLLIFQSPVAVEGRIVCRHCKGDAIAPHTLCMGLHRTAADHAGQLGGKGPGRAVIVQIGLFDLHHNAPGIILPEAIHHDNIIGGIGKVVGTPGVDLQEVVGCVVLDQGATAGNTDVDLLAVADHIVGTGSHRGIFDVPAVIGGSIFCHCGVNALAGNTVCVIAERAGKDGVEDQAAVAYIDLRLLHCQNTTAGFVLKLALDDDQITVYEGQLAALGRPGLCLKVQIGVAVNDQCVACRLTNIKGLAITHQFDHIRRNGSVTDTPIRTDGCSVGIVGNVDAVSRPAVGVVGQAGKGKFSFKDRLCLGVDQGLAVNQNIGLGDVHRVAVIGIGECAFHDQIVAVSQLHAVQL